jgi:drug/metabolite transporter superfamily protein YnfA
MSHCTYVPPSCTYVRCDVAVCGGPSTSYGELGNAFASHGDLTIVLSIVLSTIVGNMKPKSSVWENLW